MLKNSLKRYILILCLFLLIINFQVKKIDLTKESDSCNKLGLKPLKTWEVYELIDHPGNLI